MRELTQELREGDGPPLPKADARGHVPAVEYARVSLARKLIRDRRRFGLTQAELARHAKVHRKTLARVERGEVMPDASTFKKLDRALKSAEQDLKHGF